MGITSAQRLHTLEILQNIAYSKNDIEYVQNVESLQKISSKVLQITAIKTGTQ